MSSPIRLCALSATEIGANRRLILWRRQLCNHSAKGQTSPEQTQIHLPVMLFSFSGSKQCWQCCTSHKQQTEKKSLRPREMTWKGQNLALLWAQSSMHFCFSKHTLKRKGRKNNCVVLTWAELTLPNCSKYCFTSSTTVLADNPPTNIFFVLVTICKKLQDKHMV